MKKLALILLATFLALPAGLSCGSNDCPTAAIANPATATWSSGPAPMPDAGVDDGGMGDAGVGDAGAGAPVDVVVVRWSATPGDTLPDSYYASVSVDPSSGPDSPVQSVTLTSTRELTVDLSGLSAYLANDSHLDVQLVFPDTQGFVKCSNTGPPVTYVAILSLDFDTAQHEVSASFSVDGRLPPCSVNRRPGSGDGRGAGLGLMLLATAAVLALRAGRRAR